MKVIRWFVVIASVLLPELLCAQQPARVQAGANADPLDSLISRALTSSPRIAAAERRLEASIAAVGPAGALDDPMLMAGLMNQPLDGQPEEMAMRVLGVSQRIPYPGKLHLQRSAAEREVDAVRAELESTRRTVEKEVEEAYYEIAYLDRSHEVLLRNQDALADILRVTEARYGSGTSSQAEVLDARVQLASLGQEAVAITQQRRAALARLNAAVGRATDAPLEGPRVPERIQRAAVSEDVPSIRFTSSVLGAPPTDSPVLPLDVLQDRAVAQNPDLRAHERMIMAQEARVEWTRKAHLPDLDISLQYGQRGGLSDLWSAVVSIPLPIHRGGRQDLQVRESEATLAVLRAEHDEAVAAVRADVAVAYADLDRTRTQLALFATAVVPQGRAAFDGSRGAFANGRGDLLSILESQRALYGYETTYQRTMTDFAIRLTELEQLVGGEVLR